MTRPSTPPILAELRSSSSPIGQIAALRALKNEIIGHEQKKEMWIGLGVLAPIARILNSHKASGKRKHRDSNGSVNQQKRRGSRTDEEEARLQAIIVVGSLAHGGPAYVSPLNAGLVIAPLLSVLSPAEGSPATVLASLRTLNTVADSLLLDYPPLNSSSEGLVDLLYTDTHLANVTRLLSQASSSLTIQQQISLTAALITKTCREEFQRELLARCGVLDALADRLASFVVATGCCLVPNSGQSGIPPAATMRSRLAPILEAVGGIIQNSKSRAAQFLSSAAFAAVFPMAEVHPNPAYEKKAATWNAHNSSSLGPRQAQCNPIETLLPQLPSSYQRGSMAHPANFPPLGAIATTVKQLGTARAFGFSTDVTQPPAFDFTEDDESPLIAWLICIVRAENGITRLMAAWVLAILYRSGLTHRGRETGLALLLIPLLVRMLDKDPKDSKGDSNSYDASVIRSSGWALKEQAPAVLAMLAVDSIELQRAAVDAEAIKKLSQLLKESYDPLPTNSSSSLWTSNEKSLDSMDSKDNASSLGVTGVSPTTFHMTKMREAVLIALAAIASLKDEYRKVMIENGIVPFVIESLKPYSMTSVSPSSMTASDGTKAKAILLGSPTNVILAACGTARGLSRSVSTLRTDLMDAGLAAPLFVLLRHHDLEVQIAATAVICNLVLEFSPMREAILEAGILKILCEHAHSMNASLRLNSVWALKHLVLTAPNSLKKTCLDELGPGWLKQIISNDTDDLVFASSFKGDRDTGSGTPIAMGTPNAAGEQVDLLNAVEEDSRESSQAFLDENDDEDLNMVDSTGASGFGRRSTKDVDTSLTSNQTRKDDIANEKEGLDLLRNIIMGSGAAEMIDHIFRELGQDKIFELLANKLRPKVLNAFNRDRRSSEHVVRQVQAPPELVASVLYILVHIAAGYPRHRQLLISQTELLNLLVPLFTHSNKEIRTCCIWIVINSTWVDTSSDLLNCKSRARELENMGVYEQLEALEHDPELDVRERTKTALSQLNGLLRS